MEEVTMIRTSVPGNFAVSRTFGIKYCVNSAAVQIYVSKVGPDYSHIVGELLSP